MRAFVHLAKTGSRFRGDERKIEAAIQAKLVELKQLQLFFVQRGNSQA
jgi:hypothetical protein